MAMNERYEPQAIEGKWQARWEEAGVFRAGIRPGAPKKYISMQRNGIGRSEGAEVDFALKSSDEKIVLKRLVNFVVG